MGAEADGVGKTGTGAAAGITKSPHRTEKAAEDTHNASPVVRRQNRGDQAAGDQAAGSVIKPILCASNQIQLFGPHKSTDSLPRRVTGAVIEPNPDCTASKQHELKR